MQWTVPGRVAHRAVEYSREGNAPKEIAHPKKTALLYKRFVTTLSACLLLVSREKRGQFVQTVPCLGANCFALAGCLFWAGLPFMRLLDHFLRRPAGATPNGMELIGSS